MSNDPSENPSLQQRDDELVAYLDGELSPADSRRVEDLLASDGDTRRRLNQLAASWDLLDQLPRASLDDSFTRTTVEMVALATEEELVRDEADKPGKERSRWFIGGAATLLAAAIGFAMIALLLPDRNALLLNDLPIVANFELYRNVGSVEMLSGLRKAGLFDGSGANTFRPGFGADGRDDNVPAWQAVPAGEAARRQWVEEQSPEKKLELNRNFERFAALPREQQESLRRLESELDAEKNAEQSRTIVRRYYQWLANLSPVERADLNAKPPAERVAEIQRVLAKQENGALMRVVGQFGGSRGVRSALHEISKKHAEEVLKTLPQSQQQDLTEWRAKDDRGAQNRYLTVLTFELWRPGGLGAKLISEDELRPLIAQLPEEYKTKAAQAAGVEAKMNVVRAWFTDAARLQMGRPWGRGRGGPGRPPRMEDLERFRDEKLSPEEREKLSKLPENEARGKLLRLYFDHLREEQPPPEGPNRQFRRGDGERRWDGDPSRSGSPPRGERGDRNGERDGRGGSDRPRNRRPAEDFRRPGEDFRGPPNDGGPFREERPRPQFPDASVPQ